MKKVILQTERLLQFAKYLRSLDNYTGRVHDIIELVEVESKVRIHYKMKYDICILMQLPLAFPDDWHFDKGTGTPLLNGKTLDDGPIFSFSIWFGVGPEQVCHLLDIDGFQQLEKYGGILLDEYSIPKDYATNFEELAEWS